MVQNGDQIRNERLEIGRNEYSSTCTILTVGQCYQSEQSEFKTEQFAVARYQRSTDKCNTCSTNKSVTAIRIKFLLLNFPVLRYGITSGVR